MFTRVYLCLPFLAMFTYIYTSLHVFTRLSAFMYVYPCLPIIIMFTYVYSCLPMLTYVYPMFNRV